MTRVLVIFAVLLALGPSPAFAALPPFELVQKSLAKARADHPKRTLQMRVTETQPTLREWVLAGVFEIGHRPSVLEAGTAREMLWIATLAADPVAEVQRVGGVVNAEAATVGVQEQFVYVYGTEPAVSVDRDLRRLAAFSVRIGTIKWITRLTWKDDDLTGVMVTRGGHTVLTARAQ